MKRPSATTKLIPQLIPGSRHITGLLRPKRTVKVGAPPGLTSKQLAAEIGENAEPAKVSIIDYGQGRCERHDARADFVTLLKQGRPDWAHVRWIDIEGLHDPEVLAAVAEHYDLHPLAMEDVVHASQRPKAETYGEIEVGKPRYFLVARMLYEDTTRPNKPLVSEQVSMFAGPHTIITFQQIPGDVWEPVRQRIKKPDSRFHTHNSGYLLYALLDALVDAVFPLLDAYAERIDRIETRILTKPDDTIIHDVHDLKRELMLLRREAWPMRELVRSILDQDTTLMDEQTRLFLRDVGDHAVAVIELVETYRELTTGLADAWLGMMSHRMNEVMKVLTIVAALFIPISFLAGVFGMNFDEIPGLHHPAAFVFFCLACIGVVVTMLAWFKRRGWL